VNDSLLRIPFPDGTDLDTPDQNDLTKHFSVDGVEWIDSSSFDFITLSLNPDGDGIDYLEVNTVDNTNAYESTTDTYSKEYSINYWISDASNCQSYTAS